MKQKNMSRLLQALLLIAGLLGAVFFFAFLPFYGRELVQCAPKYAALFWPCLVWAWAFAVPVFWALFPCWQVFGSIARKGAAFTRENAARLRLIAYLAFADAVIFPVGMVVIALLGGGFAALTLVITPLVTFAAAAVGFACYVLSRLVLDAAVLSEENDMTI